MPKTRSKSHIGNLYRDAENNEKAKADKEKTDILSEQFKPDRASLSATTRNLLRFEHTEITHDKINHKPHGPD